MSGPEVEGDHRAALRVLAYAVLAEAIVRASARLHIRRTFVLSFPEYDEDTLDEQGPCDAKITLRMPVIARPLADGAAR